MILGRGAAAPKADAKPKEPAKQPPATDQKGAIKADAPPRTLRKMPSAADADADPGDRFADIRKLEKADPVRFDERFAEMSDADQDAYLRAG